MKNERRCVLTGQKHLIRLVDDQHRPDRLLMTLQFIDLLEVLPDLRRPEEKHRKSQVSP